MMQRRKTHCICRLAEGLVDGPLQLIAQPNVLDHSASDADQMVVMAQHRLGQLEMGVVAGADDSPDRATRFEDVEVAVGRALAESVVLAEDLRQGQGPICEGKHTHESPATRGVAMVAAVEQLCDLIVQPIEITRSGHQGVRSVNAADAPPWDK